MLQNLLVAFIVGGAFAYSAWALMPAAWRSSLRRRLGSPEVPDAGGCGGCGGCGSAARRPTPGAEPLPADSAGTSVITVHRRAAPAGGVTPRQDESADATSV